ncbi:hypothetical protein [Fusobacterium nucleatum]|uniref:hypothetical protein n=1 Tax=Fusobacterium nucleatum TaxID=851 RepID=UPI00235E6C59|nr:hypothetical protein [Fusobacterium nucleatum]WDD89629.1 hypothetical protein PSR68_03170 [Fusobacterium nucleatum]
MSEVWRLQTKTDLSQVNTNGISVAEYCINENVMAMGWTLRESIYDSLDANDKNSLKNEEKEIKNDFNKYKKIIEKNIYPSLNQKFYEGKVNGNIKRLANDIQKDDLIWIRSKGIYYLGRKTKNSKYLYKYCDDPTNIILQKGINNQLTNIEWFEIGDESDVPGYVSTSFIGGYTLQRIQKIGSSIFSQILYNKKYKEKYNEIYYKNIDIPKNNSIIKTFYSLLSPIKCEDLLYFYLYNKYGYIAIPSTNKIETQNYEFVMLNSNNREEKIYIQVKNGEVDIEINDYMDLKGKIYLLTTDGNILRNGLRISSRNVDINTGKILNLSNTFKGEIYIINPNKLFNFIRNAYDNKNILMSDLILQWFEYLK